MAEDFGYIGGLLTPRENYIPNIASAYSDIIQNAPEYQYFTSPLSNQGRTTASYGTTNQIVVAPDTQVRLVNNATGEVAYVGSGYEGAQSAIDAASALSGSAGSKANWDIQVTRPGSNKFESVSTERPDVSGLGIAADIALPVAGSLLAGPLGLGALGLGAAGTAAAGAALGSGLSSAAQGRSIEDALFRAAIAGGGSYLGSQLFAPGASGATGATVGENLPSFGVLAEPYFNAATSAAGGVAGSAAGAVPTAAGDIIVNALGGVPATVGGAFGSLATNLLPSPFDNAQFSDAGPATNTTPEEPASDYTITARVPANTNVISVPTFVPPSTTGTNVFPANPAEDLLLTAQTQTQPVVTPPVVIPPATTTPPAPPPNPAEDIIATAPKNTQVITPPLIPPIFQPPASTPPTETPKDTTPPAKKDDILGTGLSLGELATLGSLGVGILNNLFGGSGGTPSTTPYVSPFGAGTGIGTAGNISGYRVNPNISDYEKYGFGPEATFFAPGYGLASVPVDTTSSNAPVSQIYKPLV